MLRFAIACWTLAVGLTTPGFAAENLHRFLYVAEPGIRDYTQYGGHGVIVFDIDHDYKFVKRIPFGGLAPTGNPANVKGICGNASTGRLYVSTKIHLICLDLITDEVLWERQYPNGCDRMSMSPDGKVIYQPSFEKDNWYVLDAARPATSSPSCIPSREPTTRSTVSMVARSIWPDSRRRCSASLIPIRIKSSPPAGRSPAAFDPSPSTAQTRCFVNVNQLLGFEIGDLTTGKKLHRVEVQGFKMGPVKRHGCPSHGIAMTPDETQIWVTDGHNEHLHVFDATVMPPQQVDSIKVREQPGWITFSIDGKTCWPSTGDVIDTATRRITHRLTDEAGRMVMSEKLLEVQFRGNKLVAVGDQFGRGMKP